jgi:prevent-host-death family protein
MRSIPSSDMKARLPEFLDAVERGETLVVTRHGRPIAHLVPAPAAGARRVQEALSEIAALRRKAKRMTVQEILDARHHGHRR